MKTVHGARLWKVMWAGYDDDEEPWDPTWEPTKHVSLDLREAYLSDKKEGVQRAIMVDPRPLDAAVRCAIALSVQRGAQDTFGVKMVTPIGALSLVDLAEYFLASVERRFNVTRQEKVTAPGESCVEVRLHVQRDVGEFCEHELHENTGAYSVWVELAVLV
jgi:hypothetical protein